jgi:lytic murein transglycosylase
MAIALVASPFEASTRTLPADGFAAWRAALRVDAIRQGISAETFDTALRGLEPDLGLPDLVLPGKAESRGSGQAEFVKSPAEYLSERSLGALTERGRALARQWAQPLARIEKEIGVPAPIVLAIWGRETAYGTYKLPHDAIRALLTQAYLGRRKEQFRAELIAALRMLQDKVVRRGEFKSSWAGAFGLTQFMPTDFYKYAIDWDGDGRRDMLASVPDALASAANQLKGYGWRSGLPWAIEVRRPANADCTLEGLDNKRPLAAWAKLGYVSVDGKPLPPELASEQASLVAPAGVYGPAFLGLDNYFVIKSYNFADLYVLFVGNLADRIAGGVSFRAPWQALSPLPERDAAAMQHKLSADGLYTGKVDGKVGMQTRSAVGAYQKRHGLKVDCWATPALLAQMGIARKSP